MYQIQNCIIIINMIILDTQIVDAFLYRKS